MPGNSSDRHQKETEMASLSSALCRTHNPPLKEEGGGRGTNLELSSVLPAQKKLTGLQGIHSKTLYRVCE